MQERSIDTTTLQFDWDDANREKNWKKHKVATTECEEVFFNRPRVIARDIRHSVSESRYSLLGCTNSGRMLNVIFTIRGDAVRVVSARNQSRNERKIYAAYAKSVSTKENMD